MSFRWRALIALLALLGFLFSVPPAWYPQTVRTQWAAWWGAPEYQAAPASLLPGANSKPSDEVTPEGFCPQDGNGWRAAQEIEGVQIHAANTCVADNPWTVAAVVRGTNQVSAETLMRSGLMQDSVEKGADLDGDGDPDEIHIRLEVAELNGASPDSDGPVIQYDLAPGIQPGFWVFVPRYAGMATENFESARANPLLRVPSPAIRVEQGDRVRITLENSHYMPHTLHLHGSDHPFRDVSGEGNDGVPLVSEKPVMPGESRTYELQPRQAGTKFYHCHVQPHVHIMMGLQGLFVVEENRPDNWLQTLNIGAGQVRAPSQAVRADYDREYDLHYTDVDAELNRRIQDHTDPRLVTRSMHREYDVTEASSDYFALNGRSFPYTFRESLVLVKEDERVKLRVVNGSRDGIALHTHGHSMTATHLDGHAVPPGSQSARDVQWIAPAQRLDLQLSTRNDGLGAYGPGIWLFHDHGSKAVTTDGIGPGGHISAIVYESHLNEDGWPKTQGVSWAPYFTEAYYRKQVPVWQAYAPAWFSDPAPASWPWMRLLLMGLFLVLGLWLLRRP